MAEAIKVAVRVRPLNERENRNGCIVAVSMQDKTTMLQTGRSQKNFTYDFCYWSLETDDKPCHSQKDVFLDIGKAILSNALNGFNGTLFTYGQTGSGKSYSVMGPSDDPGLIPRTVADLFRGKQEFEQEAVQKDMEVWISYLEIYKEQVTDLFSTVKPKAQEQLKIMDHPKLGVYVRGLQEVPCVAYEDVMKNLDYGIKKRVVAATSMNARSSRSHAVFTIKVNMLEGQKPKPGQKDDRKILSAKVNLIDLAGSERSNKAGTDGERLKEGSAINQSLSALGMCIKALSEAVRSAEGEGKDKSSSIVPFRMSKLTFLLKDSLAGNSKTFMMATISPANENIDESLSTLRFASSVKTIQTVAIQNKDKKDEMIEKMEEEIRILKAQMMAGGADFAETGELMKERQRLKEEMQKDFQEDLRIARQMQVAREQALEDNGLSQSHITKAFGISGNPYLLNMADDPMLAGCLIYLIKNSELTRIGAHADNTITMKGVGIPDFLCTLRNDGNTKVIIERISEQGRVVVNGKLLYPKQHRLLHNGDHIFLGRAYALKLVMSGDSNVSPDAPSANDLSLEGLEDEYAALDDSPTWRSFEMYLEQVFRQLPASGHSKLLGELKKACQFCDEANELTSECRSDSLQFEVDLTTTVPPCVVIRVMYCAVGTDYEDETAWETKYLWSVSQLIDRVERMRDCCEIIKRDGPMELDLLEDPWYEADPAEVTQCLKQREHYAEELRVRLFQENSVAEKLRTLFLVGLMGPNSDVKSSVLEYFMKIWKSVVLKSKTENQLRKANKRIIARQRSSNNSTGSGSPRSPSTSSKEKPSQESNSQRPSQESNSKPILKLPSRRLTLTNKFDDSSPHALAKKSSLTSSSPSARSSARVRIHSEAQELAFCKEDTDMHSVDFGHISTESSEAPDMQCPTIHIRCHDDGRSSCCVAVAEETMALVKAEYLSLSLEKEAKFESQLELAQRDIEILRSQLERSTSECEKLRKSNMQFQQESAEISSLKSRLQRSEAAREKLQEKGTERTERCFDEAMSEIDSLRSRLRCSEQEREESKRQQDVAWKLCSVLRDYASQLLGSPASTQMRLDCIPAQTKGGACLPPGLPPEFAQWWMYNDPASASVWSAATEKMEARIASQPPIPSLMPASLTARIPTRNVPYELTAQSQGPPRRL